MNIRIADYFDAIHNLRFDGYFARKGYEIGSKGNEEFWMYRLAKEIEAVHAASYPIHPMPYHRDKYSNLLGFILFLMTERNGWKDDEMMDAIRSELRLVRVIIAKGRQLIADDEDERVKSKPSRKLT